MKFNDKELESKARQEAALQALHDENKRLGLYDGVYAIAVLEQDEPVAWMTINAYGEEDDIHYENPEGHLPEDWTYKPLYTHPPQRTWVGLTYKEQEEIVLASHSIRDAINKTDLKLKEKNT